MTWAHAWKFRPLLAALVVAGLVGIRMRRRSDNGSGN